MSGELRPLHPEGTPFDGRRYGPEDLEGILGRAMMTHARQARPRDGLDGGSARRAVLEIGRVLGVGEDHLQRAFDADADEAAVRRGWLDRLRAQPSARAVAARIRDRVLGASGADGPHYAELTDTTHELRVDPPTATAIQARLHGIRRVPCARLELSDQRGRIVRFLGFEMRFPRLVRRAELFVMEHDGRFILDGHLTDLRIVDLLGPVIADLERDLGDRLSVGNVRVDEM